MRLYLNKNEVPFVKMGLRRILAQDTYLTREDVDWINIIIERIELCEYLQENERRGKE